MRMPGGWGKENVYKYLVHFGVGTSSSVVVPKVLSLMAECSDGQTSRGKNGINSNDKARDLLILLLMD